MSRSCTFNGAHRTCSAGSEQAKPLVFQGNARVGERGPCSSTTEFDFVPSGKNSRGSFLDLAQLRRNIALISHFESVKRPARSCIVVEQVSEASGSDPAPPKATRAGEASSAAGAPPVAPDVPRWAWGLLLLLCAMNLFDSVDRWLLAAVLPGGALGARSFRDPGGLALDGRAARPGMASPLDRLSGRPDQAAAAAGGRVCALEPGDGFDRAGPHERPDASWRVSWWALAGRSQR